jgi:membrane-bound metal-dependent hydrolase YbcI (DUF457 family)
LRLKREHQLIMASPVAHTFAGFWIFLATAGQHGKRFFELARSPYLLHLGVLVLLANLPDADFLVGLPFKANEVHHGASHSLAAAIVVSAGLSLMWQMVSGFWRSTLLYFTAYSSHLLIDLCTGTRLGWTSSGYGMPLLWPWRREFSSPLILFFGVQHENLSALFRIQNAWSVLYELLTCGAISAVTLMLRLRYTQDR